MQRLRNLGQSIGETGGSTIDGNRLYSILLDTRASKASENMFDVAENILTNEKDNAKTALDQLWMLRKDMQQSNDISTVDLLIRHYQEKLDVMRNKEETIKRVSKDSRTLLEEKRKRDAEIATVKQEINDCSSEIDRLNVKLHSLKVKEQELALIEMQITRELRTNADNIVNGLYEIILTQQALGARGSDEQAVRADSGDEPRKEEGKAPATEPESGAGSVDVLEGVDAGAGESTETADFEVYKHAAPPVPPPFPKSVVKTTKGTVIGEYYYDPAVYKNRRQYIYNTSFLCEQLSILAGTLKTSHDHIRFAEAVQMVQDVQKRVEKGPNLHFEVSTNEVLNAQICRDIVTGLKTRRYDEVARACNRIGAKISALGSNYHTFLREQMKRLTE